jgi:hypothetical protein
MTFHGTEPAIEPAPDVIRNLEKAMRVARATSHSRRLDTATQDALNALADFSAAVVDYARMRDAEFVALRRDVAVSPAPPPRRPRQG